MKYRTRTFYTDQQKSKMWDRWQRGDPMGSNVRQFNRASFSISPHLARTGGIRPADRTRSRCVLGLIEREEISQELITKRSFRSIALNLNRSTSTIGHEIRKNCGLTAQPLAGPQRSPYMISLVALSTQWNCESFGSLR